MAAPDPTAFIAMRADLVARGLIDREYRLTAAGHAHVRALLIELPRRTAPCDPARRRVRWNFSRRWRRHG